MALQQVDICCGLAWGDEAKGKIVSQLASSGKYDMICRWAGGNNAGHTIYIDGKNYSSTISGLKTTKCGQTTSLLSK